MVLRHDHRAGEKMFVDYAGDKIPIHDRQTGEVIYQASLFVAVLGASNYTFAEATQSQELACWIGSHVHALEFLGGVPEAVIPDFVAGHKIVILLPAALCGLGPARALECGAQA